LTKVDRLPAPTCLLCAGVFADADAEWRHLHLLIVCDVLQRVIKAHDARLVQRNLKKSSSSSSKSAQNQFK
jgi:hypothetical protein